MTSVLSTTPKTVRWADELKNTINDLDSDAGPLDSANACCWDNVELFIEDVDAHWNSLLNRPNMVP